MDTNGKMLHNWEYASQMGECFIIGKMLHNWEYASQMGKCFSIGKMLLVFPVLDNLQTLVNGFDTKEMNGSTWYTYVCKNKPSKPCHTGKQIIFKVFECLCIPVIKWAYMQSLSKKDCWMPY